MMLAFHNDPQIKEKLLSQLHAHAKADEIIKGIYWENGKGCAVGCTVHSGRHKDYESLYGIPESLAYLEDGIFAASNNGWSKKWPIRFIEAIEPGADLSKVQWQFLHWLLVDQEDGVINIAHKAAEKQGKKLLELLAKAPVVKLAEKP